MTRAFCDEAFDGFARKKGFLKLTLVCFSEYGVTIGKKSDCNVRKFNKTVGRDKR